jgi:ribosomal protein S20
MNKENKFIQHALNGGEKQILGYKVDGYCEETKTVYQFHGCFWHGCPKCFDSDRINNKNQQLMKDLYKNTQEISSKITKHYDLVEIWECEFNKITEIKEFKKTWKREIVTPLNPRDAFFGGRTNATKLLYTCRKSHKIRYIDVCSLYPTVQFYDYYPVGHPIKILEPNYYDRNWYGFIKCKVIPPRGLYHPVLPTKIHMGKSEKLLFPLCLTCAKNKIQKCNHSDNERVIIGTWTTDEVNLAIEKGYKIDKVYEVWHFNEKSNELFRGYVKDFMKIKLETSPWKNDFKTIEEYIDTVKERLDITLEKDKIQENSGKRAVAKICLNSLWGKFGQRQNMSKTEYVTDIKRFYEIMLDDRLDNINLTFLNETMVQMSYCLKDVFVENDHNTNVFIAAFTTSNARLRLYEMLDYLVESVIYYDTDSIVYIDDGIKPIKTGCMLGEWTDELGGDYITNWVSTGPKSYDYITNLLKEICKIKGFFLNYENSQFLNFKTMSKMVKKECKGVTIVEENKITRDPKTKNIVNKYQEKFFSFDYDKRVTNKVNDEHIDTLPYGY